MTLHLAIRYIPDALPDAAAAFMYLTREVSWREAMRARATASFGAPYNYSGQRYPACPMPAQIAAIAARAAELAGHPFDNCLCNRYDTGENTMGFHADSYDGLVPSSVIAIASFGAPRELLFRTRDKRHHRAILLAHGSILLMGRATQDDWLHAIPRAPGAGLRISATFRHFGDHARIRA